MQNLKIIIFVFVFLFIAFFGLFYIDIPSPSKLIKESYQIEVK